MTDGRALRLSTTLLSGALLSAALATPALARDGRDADDRPVAVSGSLDVELRFDRLDRRGNRRAHGDAYTNTELALRTDLPSGFSVNGVFKLEQAGRERSPADTAFVDQTAWVDQLFVSWARGPVELSVGKIHPRFGFAWDRAPGIYGTDVAETYELSEKLGAGAGFVWSEALGLDEAAGTHDVRVEAFRADRGALSGSLFARRWFLDGGRAQRRNDRAVGGADNTGGFGNVVVSAEGSDVTLPVGTLDYTLGASSRKAGDDSVRAGTAATERGLVGGVGWTLPLGGGTTARPLVEVVRLENADGVRGQDRAFATLGTDISNGPWSLALTWARQRDRGPTDATVRQPAAAVGYDLGDAVAALDGLTLSVGWRRVTTGGTTANDYGTMLAYGLRF